MANRRNNWQFCDVITSTPNHPNDLKYFWQTNKKLYYKFMKKKNIHQISRVFSIEMKLLKVGSERQLTLLQRAL